MFEKKKKVFPETWTGDHISSHSLTCLKAKSDSDSSSDIAQESYIFCRLTPGIKVLDFLKIKDVN